MKITGSYRKVWVFYLQPSGCFHELGNIGVWSSPSVESGNESRDTGAKLGNWAHGRHATDGDHVQIKGKDLVVIHQKKLRDSATKKGWTNFCQKSTKIIKNTVLSFNSQKEQVQLGLTGGSAGIQRRRRQVLGTCETRKGSTLAYF